MHDVKANKYFSRIADEATDSSFKERVYVVHEDLVGRYKTGNTKAEKVTKIIKESVCRIGLDLDECRGQGYDEACNMKGRLSGVQARITSECPMQFLFTAFVIL